ncbi:MAG: hypothetical protein NVSMB57_06440 [Actinomycetota bacterium]
MRIPNVRVRTIVAVASLLIAALSATPGEAAPPAIFQVGFSVRDITPLTPQYLGGFGYKAPVDPRAPLGNPKHPGGVHDPLQVRTIAISRGKTLVAMTIVDTQGWFAGYVEGPFGVTDARNEAARQLNIDPGNLIISSTHSHAAPTIMGIWGRTDVEYLKTVYRQTVASIVDAATSMRPATLWASTANIDGIIGSAVAETDVNQGWKPDGATPVLWAKDPVTQATLGMYVNVPVHADIVIGVDNYMSADHIAAERDELGAKLGGTAVVAMGTLGRQESFVQTDGWRAAAQVGRYVTIQVLRSLEHARPVTDPSLAASTQYFSVPLTNPALAAYNAAGQTGRGGPGDDLASTCDIPAAGACPIDRSMLPPYSVAGNIGTWATAIRIGHLVYATEPGEAFPEVSKMIRETINAEDVRIVGMAQDQIGYYFPPEATPFTTVPNNSDHLIYNSSLFMSDGNVAAHALNALRIGLVPKPHHETNQYDVPESLHEGVQFISDAETLPAGSAMTFIAATTGSSWGQFIDGNPAMRGLSDEDRKTLHGRYAPFTDPIIGSNNRSSEIKWKFDSAIVTGGKEITHTYAHPGTYRVTATVPTSNGSTFSFEQTITATPPLSAIVQRAGAVLHAKLSGGTGVIVAAHWHLSDGTTFSGLYAPNGSHGTVTVIDSSGTPASTTF